eukprot:GFYU01000435.1.p1 GENE.GFYU01000435.1~~GFYU01000435.1.p1  ORF type:complete len:692 (-),score=204.41 GFYU01000435.1:388-2463(-)
MSLDMMNAAAPMAHSPMLMSQKPSVGAPVRNITPTRTMPPTRAAVTSATISRPAPPRPAAATTTVTPATKETPVASAAQAAPAMAPASRPMTTGASPSLPVGALKQAPAAHSAVVVVGGEAKASAVAVSSSSSVSSNTTNNNQPAIRPAGVASSEPAAKMIRTSAPIATKAADGTMVTPMKGVAPTTPATGPAMRGPVAGVRPGVPTQVKPGMTSASVGASAVRRPVVGAPQGRAPAARPASSLTVPAGVQPSITVMWNGKPLPIEYKNILAELDELRRQNEHYRQAHVESQKREGDYRNKWDQAEKALRATREQLRKLKMSNTSIQDSVRSAEAQKNALRREIDELQKRLKIREQEYGNGLQAVLKDQMKLQKQLDHQNVVLQEKDFELERTRSASLDPTMLAGLDECTAPFMDIDVPSSTTEWLESDMMGSSVETTESMLSPFGANGDQLDFLGLSELNDSTKIGNSIFPKPQPVLYDPINGPMMLDGRNRSLSAPAGPAKADSKKRKAPGSPIANTNINAFMFFRLDKLPLLKQEMPEADRRTVAKRLADMWKATSPTEKRIYEERARVEREKVEAQMRLEDDTEKQPERRRKLPSFKTVAFNHFAKENRERVKNENPTADANTISRKLGELWKAAAPEERRPYEERARIQCEWLPNAGSDTSQAPTPAERQSSVYNEFDWSWWEMSV